MNDSRHRQRLATRMKMVGVFSAATLLFAACGSDADSAGADADDVAASDSQDTETTADDAMEDSDGEMMGAFGPACGSVPADGEGSFAGMADDTAATAASNNPLLSTLVTAVSGADLVDTLNSDGPFTIFAPTNEAFEAIPDDVLAAVLNDRDLLTSVLTYHVIGGESWNAEDLASAGASPTVEGEDVNFGAEGTSVNDATVVCSNVTVANGTVHIIDQVLLPPVALDAIAAMSGDTEEATADMLGASGPACGSVPADGEGSFAGMADDTAATAASNNPLLSTLVTAVAEADLVDTLNSDGPFTIFAPTNDAFAALPEADLSAALGDVDLLTGILTYHVIGGESLSAADLIAAGTMATVNGAELSFEADGDQVLVNGTALAICQNVPTANATVHIIDSVLVP